MDGTYAEAGRSAVGKAVASAATGQPSGEITHVHEHLAPALVIAEGMPVSRIPGGLPVWRGGVIQGACGVAGAPSNDLDEMCARAGVAGFGTYAPR
jgi:uncharacterized protein GlcG (DUF336 family)